MLPFLVEWGSPGAQSKEHCGCEAISLVRSFLDTRSPFRTLHPHFSLGRMVAYMALATAVPKIPLDVEATRVERVIRFA